MITAGRSTLLDVDIRATLRDVTDPPRAVSGGDPPLQICTESGHWKGVISGLGDGFLVHVPVSRIEADPGARVVISLECDVAPDMSDAPRTLGSVEIGAAGSYRLACELPVEDLVRAQENGLWIGTKATITGAASIRYGAYIAPAKFGA